ncbi:NERD domain-containing protein [Xanthomonas sp. WHRI 10064A]|uniref:NERD domain-containing protein n=1 Tax=unclassified Xanthomonas TaxID=2643310 RepID=UPI002B2277F7|nr:MULTISPECIES: NERD domain-containing protein [unclassified Xanthomonas]MEA9585886.1 NERD domain-containing protein [Xanthomonas sp. WHRI 10064B]MEA9614313.1 NERD domain-containing protein [Xanthomonas sp. WHRI 10064A]
MSAALHCGGGIRLFIGERIEHASDREILVTVCDALNKGTEWAYVFANFNVSGRQVDVAIFSATTTLVIEAKGYTQPVKGGVNGSWTQVGPYGSRKLRNGYTQALDAKNALRDVMAGLFGPLRGYPNALLAIAPAIPSGSSLPPSDFKVAIGGSDAVEVALRATSGALLSEERCEALAAHLGLERVSGRGAAIHDAVLAAERNLLRYESSFLGFHGPTGKRLEDDQYNLGDKLISASEVLEKALLSRSALLIRGPSGCGKSLLSARIATECLQAGVLPIHIQGKDFEGKLQKIIDAELGLLGTSARDLLSASRHLGRQLVLFLDGYNECPEPLHTVLTRALQAFSLRYGAGVVLTSQNAMSRQELLSIEEILVSPPQSALKSRLAKLSPEDENFTNGQALLEIARSGLEAELIGQAAASLPAGASKFLIFDTVARRRLGDSAAAGTRALCGFAEELISQAAFSLSVREFDRFCDATDVADVTRRLILQSRLVSQRGDRISFSHEMFFSAFMAESVVRAARKDSERVQAVLRSPRFHGSKVLIIGAIEDDSTLRDVLDKNTDQGILESCVRGECGDAARRIVNAKLDVLLAEMVAETSDLRFLLNGEGWHSSSIETGARRSILAAFEAFLPAIGWLLIQGLHLDRVMTACRAMERKLVEANRDLYEEARVKKVPLRHETFGQAFLFNREIALSQLVNFVHSGGLSFRHSPGPEFDTALKNAWSEANTHSEFYFLLRITKFTEHAAWAAPYVLNLLERLKTLPYHLQLDTMDFCVWVRDVDDVVKAKMIAALEGSMDKLGWLMNSMIFDALKGLGGLDAEEENYRTVVLEEIESALSNAGPQADTEAWNVFSHQFDHPYDSIYWEEVDNLARKQKQQLLFKALKGASSEYVSFVGILIRQLANFGDPAVSEAIEPWLRLPAKRSVMPQDAVEAFFAAHEAMGGLSIPLPAAQAFPVDVDETMRACGELAYWACRLSDSELESSTHTLGARTTLLAHSASASAGALWSSTSRMLSSDGARTQVAKSYPKTALVICRDALKHRESQKSYEEHGFKDDRASIASFSIQVIGQFGDADDFADLRILCDDEGLGREALDAIKKIEDRIRYRQ